MGSSKPLAIVPVAGLADVSFIDGGQTLVARLEASDGSETALLIPYGMIAGLTVQLTSGAQAAAEERIRRFGQPVRELAVT